MAKKALAVDDAKNIAHSVKNILEGEGFEVVVAFNTQQALDALAAGEFDMVVTDREMHGDENAGFTVAQAARARGMMPIVMLSTVMSDKLPAVKLRLGAIGGQVQFISKLDDFYDPLVALAQRVLAPEVPSPPGRRLG